MTLVTEAVIFAAQVHDGAARKGSMIRISFIRWRLWRFALR